MKVCKKCGWPIVNGGGDICPACRQRVVKSDWRQELEKVERNLKDEEAKSEGKRSEAFIKACRARIAGIKEMHRHEYCED